MLSAVMALFTAGISVHAADVGDQRSGIFSYRILDDGNAEITRVYFAEGQTALVIPQEIDGYTVTSLGYYAMGNYAQLESVEFPGTLTNIGDGAFSLCKKLRELTLPESLKTIDTAAFFGCSSLTELTIPDGVTTIGSTAFRQCRGLEKVTIPDSVTSIGKMAFFVFIALHKVRIPSSTSDIGEMAFGYVLDNGAVPDPGFVMQGVDDSAAQQYAAANDIPFIPDGTMIRGDSDGDGRVTIIDATVIQRGLVGLPVASFNEICSDVDGNGLDITDATKIQRYLADIPDPYHIGEPIV